MIEINKNPSKADLKWFGLIFAVCMTLVAGLVWWRFDAVNVARIIAGVGWAVCAVYYIARPVQRHIFVGWLYLTFPIGFVMSHVIMGLTYFLILTPIGLIMRAVGRDPMQRQLDPDAKTYWEPRKPVTDMNRYFKQF